MSESTAFQLGDSRSDKDPSMRSGVAEAASVLALVRGSRRAPPPPPLQGDSERPAFSAMLASSRPPPPPTGPPAARSKAGSPPPPPSARPSPRSPQATLVGLAPPLAAVPDPFGDVTTLCARAVSDVTPRRPRRTWLTVGAITVICALVTIVALVIGKRPGTGQLLITVAAPKSVASLEVYVDGRLSCRSAPCLVERLQNGTHLVHVVRAGSKPTAQLAATVTAGTQRSLHVELTDSEVLAAAGAKLTAPTQPVRRVASVEQPSAVPEEPTPPTRSQPADPSAGEAVVPRVVAQRAALPRTESGAAPAAPAVPSAASSASSASSDRAILRITSVPSAGVTVDGRPVGSTPRTVRLPPGTHRVAFFGSEGRALRTVTVAAGETADVSAQF